VTGPRLPRSTGSTAHVARSCFALGLVLATASPARAQVVRLGAGSSSSYRASGGTIEVHSGRFEGWLGVGSFDRARLGGAAKLRAPLAEFTIGDDVERISLPTDVFDASHRLCTRGAGARIERGGLRLSAVGGTTSSLYSTPYFTASRPGHALGSIGVEARLAPAWTLTARDLWTERSTHLVGLGWAPPRNRVQAALTGGVGADAPYAAGSLAWETEALAMRAALVRAGDGFHRVLAEQAEGSELDGGNMLVRWRPSRTSSLSVGHNGYAQPAAEGRSALRGSVDQLLASASAAGASFDVALFHSRSAGAGGTGASAGAARDLGSRLRADLHLQHAGSPRTAPMTSVVGQLRERVSQRLDLVQVITHSAGNTTVSFGGSYLSSAITLGIDYQTLYVPFASTNPFRQALMLSAGLQLGWDFRFHASTSVGPDGRVRYTAYGDQFLHRDEGSPRPPASIGRFVVIGRVVDGQGNPVEGAALRVAGQETYTDSRGAFVVRSRRQGPQALEVLPQESTTPQPFEVIHAPTSVTATAEDHAREVTVVVSRVHAPASNAPLATAPPPADAGGDTVVSASPAPRADSTSTAPSHPIARLVRSVHFAFDSARLGPASLAALDSIAARMVRSPGLRLVLHGHADRRGPRRYNLNLSRRRVLAVQARLVQAGADPARIVFLWHGSSRPTAGGSSPLASARNRRVEFDYVADDVQVELSSDETDLQLGRH